LITFATGVTIMPVVSNANMGVVYTMKNIAARRFQFLNVSSFKMLQCYNVFSILGVYCSMLSDTMNPSV